MFEAPKYFVLPKSPRIRPCQRNRKFTIFGKTYATLGAFGARIRYVFHNDNLSPDNRDRQGNNFEWVVYVKEKSESKKKYREIGERRTLEIGE